MVMNNLLSLANFSKLVKDVTACDNCAANDTRMMDNVRHELLTSHGYFAYVGEENATKLSNAREDFIVGCFLHKREAFRSYRDGCRSQHFSRIVDSDYYNCWTMDLPEFEDGSLTGISIILHLDNFFTEHYDNFHISYEHGQYIGALITMHVPQTFPTLFQKSVFLPPGAFSDIKLKVIGRTRLQSPYANCTAKQKLQDLEWYYTRDACVSACLERAVVSQCSCKDLFTLSVREDLYQNLSYCNDPSQGHDLLVESSRCASIIRQAKYGECLMLCPFSCKEIAFQPQVSTATWPPDPFHHDFYDDFIAGRSYEWRYRNISRYIAGENSRGDVEWMLAKELVSRNFLRVDVSLRDIDYVMYIDSPKTSVSSFLSQMGGTLNLFAGITIVIGVELLDLLISLFTKKKVVEVNNTKPAVVDPARTAVKPL